MFKKIKKGIDNTKGMVTLQTLTNLFFIENNHKLGYTGQLRNSASMG